jgi:hypothetical protein
MALESPVARDGDAGFVGYASRLNPITLPAGMLQQADNMRLDRGFAQTRKGAKRMASGISPSFAPLTIPFSLAASPTVRSVYDGGVFASAVVRSPDAVNSFEVVVLAAPSVAYVVTLDESSDFSETWSGGVIMATDGVNPNEEILTHDGFEILATALSDTLTYPAGESVEVSDKVSMVQAFNRLYLLREADTTRAGWTSQGVTASGITVSGTTATVNVSGHGYSAGNRVRITNGSVAAFDGHEYDVLSSGLTTNAFQITVPSGTATDLATTTKVRRVKAPLYWDLDPSNNFVKSPAGVPAAGASFVTMPSVAWATYHNGRLIIPSGRDSVLISDWGDSNTYDPFFQSFRANQGSNDFLVGVHPWVEGSFLVFMRKSIWLATVNQFSSTDGTDFAVDTALSKLELLTDEVGCAARASIQTAGQYVYFLSDSGVYRLDARLDLKLRGDTKPLSDAIADQLQGIDPNAFSNSIGLWYDNRYWLAVPQERGKSPKAWLFIYSALNESWESRDTYGFGADNVLVATVGNRRRVMLTSQAGTLFMLEENNLGDDAPDPSIADYNGTVNGLIRTRRYGMGSMHSKRFLRALSDVALEDKASLRIDCETFNPDFDEQLVLGQTNDSGLREDYTLKQPIRRKAHYAELVFRTTAGRPEIRNVSIEAALASLPQTETRNAA